MKTISEFIGDKSVTNYMILLGLGFTKVKTEGDHEQFGVFANAETKTIMVICEGDLIHHLCASKDEYDLELQKQIDFHKEVV